MTINARLKQSDLELNSQKIVYDTLKKIIVAGGDDKAQAGKATPASVTSPQSGKKPETSQRVNITLTPKKQLSPEEPDAK